MTSEAVRSTAKQFGSVSVSLLACWYLMPRLHQDATCCIHLYSLVAVKMDLVSTTKFSPVCRLFVAGYKGIQVDRDVNEHSNYVAEIQSTSILNEQLVSVDICVRIQVARPGYMFPGDICPGVNGA